MRRAVATEVTVVVLAARTPDSILGAVRKSATSHYSYVDKWNRGSVHYHNAAAITTCIFAFFGIVVSPSADGVGNDCAPGDALAPKAEMFATNATTSIVDPTDGRVQDHLQLFESQVDRTILTSAALPVGSHLNRGVFWSTDLQATIYEPSRSFYIACVDDEDLRRIAEDVAEQFHQESVLTFAYPSNETMATDSFIAEIPGVDPERFREALAVDSAARERIGGGSIRDDGTLVLVAADEDAVLAGRLVAKSGAYLDMSNVRRGRSSFVSPANTSP